MDNRPAKLPLDRRTKQHYVDDPKGKTILDYWDEMDLPSLHSVRCLFFVPCKSVAASDVCHACV
jgi:hypothetical protein